MIPFQPFRPVVLFCLLLLIGSSSVALPPGGGVVPAPLPETDLGEGLGPEDYSGPVPIVTGDTSDRKIEANRIHFFRHPVSQSQGDFGDLFSQIQYRLDGVDHVLRVPDLIGAPHFLYNDERPANAIEALLEDPADLCFEDLLLHLDCPREVLIDPLRNQLAGAQLVADLRNLKAGEENVPGSTLENVILNASPYTPPYQTHPLSMITTLDSKSSATCYDITSAEDWLACPVFGKMFVNNNASEIELESPVVLYRLSDGVYKLAGYLGNPAAEEYHVFQRVNPLPRMPLGNALSPPGLSIGNVIPLPRMPLGNALFPLAIESADFYAPKNGPKNAEDIAVFSTATLPRYACDLFLLSLREAGYEEDLPHRHDCSYGFLWGRIGASWDQPLRKIFDAVGLFIAPPQVFDVSAGFEKDSPLADLGVPSSKILFAASAAQAQNGKYYVYKYFENSRREFLSNKAGPHLPPLIVPEAIEVRPPAANFAPFRIRTRDYNKDGLSDFALTWIHRRQEVDGFSLKRKGIFSPFVSVFTSRRNGNHVKYDQFDFQPADGEAQIVSVDFGSRGGRDFLAVGDYRRIGSETFVYTVPIGGGLFETNQIQKLQVRFQQEIGETYGVSDVLADKQNGAIATLQRDPFLRAPEGCDIAHADVYGYYWSGSPNFDIGEDIPLDADKDGVPNRCECVDDSPEGPVFVLPNDREGSPAFDPDMDEIATQCDTCPDKADIGDLDGDGIDEACDHCPASVCLDLGKKVEACAIDFDRDGTDDVCDNCPKLANADQSDRDGDNVGDICDSCPDFFDPVRNPLYTFATKPNGGERVIDHCTPCRNAYFDVAGNLVPMGHRRRDGILTFEDAGCAEGLLVTNVEHDSDMDGVTDAYDNCLYRRNGPNQNDVEGVGFQTDSDGDGEGDACECGAMPEQAPSDCDGDGLLNRFDLRPWDHDRPAPPEPRALILRQPPDTVYDPRAGYIAKTGALRFAAARGGNVRVVHDALDPAQREQFRPEDFSRRIDPARRNVGDPDDRPEIIPFPRCGFERGVFPGAEKCQEIEGHENDITLLLPKVGKDVGAPEEPPPPPLPESGVAIQQFCIARVGRSDPRMISPVAASREKIMEANNRAQAITGLKDFDIFVGSDGGLMRWECYLAGGAAPKIAAAKNVLPDVSGNIASFGVWQIKGLPVERKYNFAPDPNDHIDPKLAMRLAPLDDARAFTFSVAGGGAPAAGALAPGGVAPGGVAPGGVLGALPVPNVGALMVSRSEQMIPADNVQFGHLRQNINGNMVLKVLNSESDLRKEGVAFSASDTHSIIAIDYKTQPAPFTDVPVEDRPYALMNIDKTLERLEQLVLARKKRGEVIDVTIFRELKWGEAMQIEFLLAQETIPEALAGVSKVVGGSVGAMPEVAAIGPVATPTNRIILPAFVVEPSMSIQGTGLCRLQPGVGFTSGLSAWLLWMLPVPVWIRWRLRRKSISSRSCR